MLERRLRRLAESPWGSEVAYIGPTLQHAKDLAWDYFENRFIELGIKFLPKLTERYFALPGKRKLYVLGAEKIDRVRGHKLWDAGLDEVAYFSKPLSEVWKALYPTLTDYKGTCDFGTTPDGKGSDCYEFYMANKDKESFSYHHWVTMENPYIDPIVLEEAKKDLDAKAFAQEYLATWESYEGLAYYNFDDKVHVQECGKVTPDAPITIAMDFNVNPTTLLVTQYVGGKKFVRREYSFADSSTERTIKAFIDDYKLHPSPHPISIRGDSAGNQRKSTTGKSDYAYIFEALNNAGIKYLFQVPSVNPAIIDRVNTMNGWLKPMIGQPRIVIDRSCKHLIKDLAGQKLNGRLPSDENNLGHKGDALGYDVYWESLFEKRPQSTSKRI